MGAQRNPSAFIGLGGASSGVSSFGGRTGAIALQASDLQADFDAIIDPRRAPYNLPHPSTWNSGVETWAAFAERCRAILQSAIDVAHAARLTGSTCAVMLNPWRATIPLSRNIDVPDTVSVFGVHEIESAFEIVGDDTTCCSCTIRLTPFTGRSKDFVAQRVEYLSVRSSQNFGRTGIQYTCMAGSNVLTATTSWSGPGAVIPAGYTIEGYGIPKDTVVVSHVGSAITISANATYTPTAAVKAIVRRAVRVSGSCTANSTVLTVASTAGIQVGMLATSLQSRLSDVGRVIAVNAGANTVTLDDAASSTGADTLTFRVEIDGFRVERADQAHGYDPLATDIEYKSPKFHRCNASALGGTGFMFRSGRHAVHTTWCFAKNNDGWGIHLVGCNDSRLDNTSSGGAFRTCLYVAGCATPRWRGESWSPGQVDKYYTVEFRNIRELELMSGEVTGPIYLSTVSGETAPIASVVAINQKWFKSSMAPDPTQKQAYITADRTHVNVIGGGMKWVDETGGVPHRPNYLFMAGAGDATMSVVGCNMSLDIANKACPFTEKESSDLSRILFSGCYDPISKTMVERGARLMVDGQTWGDKFYDKRPIAEGGNRNVGGSQHTQYLHLGTNAAAYSITLPDPATFSGNMSLELVFSGSGSIAALTWPGATFTTGSPAPTAISGACRLRLDYLRADAAWSAVGPVSTVPFVVAERYDKRPSVDGGLRVLQADQDMQWVHTGSDIASYSLELPSPTLFNGNKHIRFNFSGPGSIGALAWPSATFSATGMPPFSISGPLMLDVYYVRAESQWSALWTLCDVSPASTWANRGTGVAVGQRKTITNIGNNVNVEAVWDGSGWRPAGGRQLLYRMDGIMQGASGLTSTVTLPVVAIPGGLMGSTGRIDVELYASSSTAPSSRSVELSFGAAAIYDDDDDSQSVGVYRIVRNKGSSGAQIITSGSKDGPSPWGDAGKQYIETSVDTSSSKDVGGAVSFTAITAQVATVAEYAVWWVDA